MNRRGMLLTLPFAAFGCEASSRFREARPMRSINYPELIAARATAATDEADVAQLDPATIALVAGLIWDLIRYCVANNIRKQWERLNAHPHGFTEQRLRTRLTKQVIEQQPDADAERIDSIVASHLTAFRLASRDEINGMIEAAAARNMIEDVDWQAAKRVSELTKEMP